MQSDRKAEPIKDIEKIVIGCIQMQRKTSICSVCGQSQKGYLKSQKSAIRKGVHYIPQRRSRNKWEALERGDEKLPEFIMADHNREPMDNF